MRGGGGGGGENGERGGEGGGGGGIKGGVTERREREGEVENRKGKMKEVR